MKITIVPAQVTTVEDKITARLTISQVFLLAMPLLVGCIVFLLLPPFFDYATYKVVVVAAIGAVSAILAIRINEKILLQRAVIYFGYKWRPRIYIFDKNDSYMRTSKLKNPAPDVIEEAQPVMVMREKPEPTKTAEVVRIESLLTDPAANVHFDFTKKGELRVKFTETQE